MPSSIAWSPKMRFIRLILIGILIFLSKPSVLAQLPTYDLSDVQEVYGFKGVELGYIEDANHSISINDVVQDPNTFSRTLANDILPSSPKVHWLAFDLSISDQSYYDYFLEIANAHLGDYQIWMYQGDTLLKHRRQGDNYEFHKREIAHNFFIHRLPDVTGDLRIVLRVDQQGQETTVPLAIYTNDYFVRHTLRVKIIHGLIIGLFLITTIITFSLYFANRYKYFIYEVIVSIASIIYILSEEGYSMMFFWPSHPHFNGYSRPLAIGAVVIFSLLFTLDFIELKKHKKSFMRLAVIMIVIYSGYLLFAHPIDVFSVRTSVNIGSIITIFLILTLIITVYTAFIALYAWVKEKSTDGMVVFLIFSATVISLGVRLLALQGLGSSSEWVQHTGFITRGIHVPLIGAYIVYTAIKVFQRSRDEQIALLEERSEQSKVFIERLDAERQRISMALHDSAGSMITGLKHNLHMLGEEDGANASKEHYQESLRLSNKLQEEIRNISNDLLPGSIVKLGLRLEIKRLLSRLESTYNIKTRLESNETVDKDIDTTIIFHLYYIIRESLDNIVKYADASSVLVQYYVYEDEINLLIEDNGKGFDKAAVLERGGNGLRNMALRVSWLQGHIDLYSGDGTSITINVPLKQKEV